ncbi:hypothetical protein [Pseudobutyrivibrio xylanivorans]|uniref:Uncharacterized protein n=1 Tax=Pseudobutyrivibrio xylanivorans TaxID=185007 RepID=A0A1G5RRG1_PSEXY|nr:hypothetical protein [Pseudobutyrivibrio xylanivorans]SCZ76448.1 hypothetical protein SAMN02910350_00259 [Pseudobutyrivibrio xylanivorans]
MNYNDPEGDVSDVYDLSMNIEKTSDGANVTFAISNDDNQHATIIETEITNVTPPAAE